MPVKTFRAAVCWIPRQEHWLPLQAVRRERDRAFARWPPHVNLLYPFYDDTSSGTLESAVVKLSEVREFAPPTQRRPGTGTRSLCSMRNMLCAQPAPAQRPPPLHVA